MRSKRTKKEKKEGKKHSKRRHDEDEAAGPGETLGDPSHESGRPTPLPRLEHHHWTLLVGGEITEEEEVSGKKGKRGPPGGPLDMFTASPTPKEPTMSAEEAELMAAIQSGKLSADPDVLATIRSVLKKKTVSRPFGSHLSAALKHCRLQETK